jgi:tripartite-type tricarboxylate transporter receptor subunit TctC
VPAGTPPEVIAKLSDALAKTIAQPDVRDKFATQGLDAASSTAEEFSAHIRSEVPKWIRVAKSANIKVE